MPVAKMAQWGRSFRYALAGVGKFPCHISTRRPNGGFLLFSAWGFLILACAIATAAESRNGWRLLRTANPRGGPDAVSMTHTADMIRSDLDLAGMLLKCGEHGFDVVIVAVSPFPPRSRPQVTIGSGGKEWRFDATVVPPGAELQLPAEAAELAAGNWQSARELTIHVASPERSFGGVIPVEGLAAALATLSASCPAG